MREVDLLRYLSARSLETIEWIDGPEATTHFGTGAADGVVRIRTKRGGRR